MGSLTGPSFRKSDITHPERNHISLRWHNTTLQSLYVSLCVCIPECVCMFVSLIVCVFVSLSVCVFVSLSVCGGIED